MMTPAQTACERVCVRPTACVRASLLRWLKLERVEFARHWPAYHTGKADLPYGRSAEVVLSRGQKQDGK
jgi:hypothetical protein